MNRYLITLIALGLLAGCATAPPPPLKTDDPASPSAPEAPVRTIRNALSTDLLTRKTRQILAQAAGEPRRSDQTGPDAGDQQGEEIKNLPTQSPQQQMPQGSSQPSPTADN